MGRFMEGNILHLFMVDLVMEKQIDFQQNGNTLEGKIQRAQGYCTEVQAALANDRGS